MEDSALAGVRDATSMTCRIVSESPALLASALKADAADNANPRETDCSGAPSWAAISVTVDGLMIDDKRVYRESVTSASLADRRLQSPYHARLRIAQVRAQRIEAIKDSATPAAAPGAALSRPAVSGV